MFLIDGPFVSKYLKQTLASLHFQVVNTPEAQHHLKGYTVNFTEEKTAVSLLKEQTQEMLYTNSENALSWLYSNLPESNLAKSVLAVKDKACFRDKLAPLHPDFYYQSHSYSDLTLLDPKYIPFPIILKPSVGFFSLGVHQIENTQDWQKTIATLDQTVEQSNGLYPSGVLDNSIFILEEIIPGSEFAVDCYYDSEGQVVIFNIMQHLFASPNDVNDRVYITSASIIKSYLEPIQFYLNKLGTLFQLSTFPAHIELRIDSAGAINAIEINPLRFGGWCSTPDMSHYAWGINVYDLVSKQLKPDWNLMLTSISNRVYALIVLDNSTGHPGSQIKQFNYEALWQKFSHPLELRKTDFTKHPLFGFLMCQVAEGQLDELYNILHSDLNEFISLENELG